MSTKKKLLISVCSLGMVVLLAVLTLVAVFAAENQQFQSQISVTYRATNVSATISGDYLRKGDSAFTSMGAPIEFLPSDVSDSQSIGLNGLELDEFKTYAVLRYTFKNNSASTKIYVEAKSTINTYENISVNYYGASSEITDYDNITLATLSHFTIDKLETYYIYVKIRVIDISTNASFSGNFSFDLSKVE